MSLLVHNNCPIILVAGVINKLYMNVHRSNYFIVRNKKGKLNILVLLVMFDESCKRRFVL